MSQFAPVVVELRPAPDAEKAFLALCNRRHCLFMDSALRHPTLGRYSFVTADPFDYCELPADGTDGLTRLSQLIRGMMSETATGLPPFQGGAAGLFGYDLNRSLEQIPEPQFDEFGVPAMAVGLYDVVLAFDHRDERAWLISQGLPEREPAARRRRAEERIAQFRRWLAEPDGEQRQGGRSAASETEPISRHRLARQFATSGEDGLTSNFSADGYRDAVGRVIDYIYAGDAFQVNLAQRLLYPAVDDSVTLYLRLRRRNAATFSGYFDLGNFQIVSASPERFLTVRDRCVETRPIKGTCQRTLHPEADLFAGEALRESEKDRSENVMIVDLLRNDLSRVCHPDSVKVTQLCELEVYGYVQHLVSAVCGELADNNMPLDLLRAAFPGGSITGAPKVRAMEIIAELEPTARGPYCGSLGYSTLR